MGVRGRGGEFYPAEQDVILEQTLSPAYNTPFMPFLLNRDCPTWTHRSLGPLSLGQQQAGPGCVIPTPVSSEPGRRLDPSLPASQPPHGSLQPWPEGSVLTVSARGFPGRSCYPWGPASSQLASLCAGAAADQHGAGLLFGDLSLERLSQQALYTEIQLASTGSLCVSSSGSLIAKTSGVGASPTAPCHTGRGPPRARPCRCLLRLLPVAWTSEGDP